MDIQEAQHRARTAGGLTSSLSALGFRADAKLMPLRGRSSRMTVVGPGCNLWRGNNHDGGFVKRVALRVEHRPTHSVGAHADGDERERAGPRKNRLGRLATAQRAEGDTKVSPSASRLDQLLAQVVTQFASNRGMPQAA